MEDVSAGLAWLEDDRLARVAVEPAPVWLWSRDCSRIAWANAAGAACFGARAPSALAARRFPPDNPCAFQVARLAPTLYPGGTPRLERLRGFGAGIGKTLLCACSRFAADADMGWLIAAQEVVGPVLPLAERAAFFLAGAAEAAVAFLADGRLVAATEAGRRRIGAAETLSAIGAEALALAALADGTAAGDTLAGEVRLSRLGGGASAALVAVFAARPASARGVAGGSASRAVAGASPTPISAPAPDPAPPSSATAASAQASGERRDPLRFVWRIDPEGRFTLASDEFIEAVGSRTAAALGRPWKELAAELDLDPDGRVLQAIESRDAWSGLAVLFPVDARGERLAVELSGLPVYDRSRTFLGYRGFGVCREAARIARRARPRQPAAVAVGEAAAAAGGAAGAAPVSFDRDGAAVDRDKAAADRAAAPGENVVRFPAAAGAPAPVSPGEPSGPPAFLSPNEHNAFREIARQLQVRLAGGAEALKEAEQPQAREDRADRLGLAEQVDFPQRADPAEPPAAAPPPASLAPPPGPLEEPQGDTVRAWPAASAGAPSAASGRALGAAASVGGAGELAAFLDRLPVGFLIYRYDQPIYANRAFLDTAGYARLDALVEAGGLDSLFVESGSDAPPRPDRIGQPLTILTGGGERKPVAARLFALPWEGEGALALMLLPAAAERGGKATEMALRRTEAHVRELRSILDTAFDGVIVLDRAGRIQSANRSAEALFGYDANELAGRPFADLFAPAGRGPALGELERLREGGAALLGAARETAGRTRGGETIPLSMTMGAMTDGGDSVCAVFRDLTPWKRAEADVADLARASDHALADQSAFLARLSQGVRTPLGAVLGFADLMLEERFGPVGNDRYRGYLRDIRAAAQRIAALLDDLLDLAQVESGARELAFASLDLNALTQACVKSAQAEAGRARIILRTALAPELPPVIADARSMEQIVHDLLSNAIALAGAGGQVIVSTGANEQGQVALRVRASGAALPGAAAGVADAPRSAADLALAVALAEANRGALSVVSKPNAGTLIEVAFPGERLSARPSGQ